MISQTGSVESDTKVEVEEDDLTEEYKIVLKWRNIIVFIYLHVSAVWCVFDPPHMMSTYIIQFWMVVWIGFGTTVGSHRWENIYFHMKLVSIALISILGCSPTERIERNLFWSSFCSFCRQHRVKSRWSDGWEIIACIINSLTQMLTHITQSVDSSSVTWAGFVVKSIPKSLGKAERLIWVTWKTTECFKFKRSEVTNDGIHNDSLTLLLLSGFTRQFPSYWRSSCR